MKTGFLRQALSVSAVLATLCTALPAQAAQAAATTSVCGIKPYGLIGARWNELGGEASGLGCPAAVEGDVYREGVWAGHRQRFARGQMVWSPGEGPKLVVSAWSIGGYAYVDWRSTLPRVYDRFLIRWVSAADSGGTEREVGGGDSGRMRVRVVTSSGYRFYVQGCDVGVFKAGCKHGWTVSVTAR
ncbi:hypothetical protein [Nonomuraea sp. NPDC002799]